MKEKETCYTSPHRMFSPKGGSLLNSIADYITVPEQILAHINQERPESLVDHSDLVHSFFLQLCGENGLDKVLKRTIAALQFNDEELPEELQELIAELFVQAIYLHDIGKINPAFQYLRMDNQRIKFCNVDGATNSNHSMLSALLYIDLFSPRVDEIGDTELRGFLRHILYVFAYVISRHHTYLTHVEDEEGQFYKNLKEWHGSVRRYPQYVEYYKERERLLYELDLGPLERDVGRYADDHEPYSLFILVKLLYSTLVSCDFYAVYSYENQGERPPFHYFTKEGVTCFLDSFKQTKTYRGIQEYQHNPHYFDSYPINALRSQIFLEAEAALINHADQRLFYLEAPTGSGKTNTSINLALRALQTNPSLNKIIYIFPFNTLIEQTKATFDNAFPNQIQQQHRIAVVNSITPIINHIEEEISKKNENTLDYHKDLREYREEVLRRQMLQYPITLTSHVNFFNYLFGQGRESNLAFTHLCNSVVIFDEIQSYRNDIWVEIIRFLNAFSEMLNLKIIIMSATLPKLDYLLDKNVPVVELLPNAKQYFEHPLFQNRVSLHFDLLEQGALGLEDLLEEVLKVRKERGSSRIMVEFISKEAAEQFYELAQRNSIFRNVVQLTGNDHRYYRKIVIAKLSEKDEKTQQFVCNDVLLVATQVIEAGVDIDLDVGFKDISLLDSEEQFLGRINRSCLRSDCHAYFFHHSIASYVYKNDWRLEHDLKKKEYQLYLQEKSFDAFYQQCFLRLLEQNSAKNERNYQFFLNDVQSLNFPAVSKHMHLINDQASTLFIDYQCIMEDGKVVQGKDVWEQYKSLLKNRILPYAERRVQLSIIQEKMDYFTFPIHLKKRDDKDASFTMWSDTFIGTERLGDMIYVENGERFMKLDKFTGTKRFFMKKYRK